MYKNVNTVSDAFSPHETPEHAVIIDDVIIVGRRLVRTYITREACM